MANRRRPHPTTTKTPTLDLHNHRLTTAISSTTSFLSGLIQRHHASCPYVKSSGISNTGKPGTCSCAVHCIIVTGSGSHSSDGPVLRSAIDKLLQRRRMTYHITPHSGRGSFTVDANSGHELVYRDEGRRTDSKVVVARSRAAAMGQEEWPDLPPTSGGGGGGSSGRMASTAAAAARRHDPTACVGADGRQPLFVGGGRSTSARSMGSRQSSTASNANAGGGGIPAAQDQRVRPSNQDECNEEEEVLDVFPLPREVAADDAVLSHVKQMSASEAAQRQSQAVRERNALQRAMEQSAEDEANRRQELEGAEAEQMAQALRLSREESLRLEMEMEEGTRSSSGTSIEEMDDDEFDRLIEASLREEEERRQRDKDREQEELERALQLSQQMEHNASNGSSIDNDEEDEELLKALAMSKQESRRNSAIGSTSENEEDDIKRAMEESLAMASEEHSAVGLDGISGSGHLDDDEAAMIRQAMELSIQAEEERTMLYGALGNNDSGQGCGVCSGHL